MATSIEGDIFRAYGSYDSLKIVRAVLLDRTVRVVLTHRFAARFRGSRSLWGYVLSYITKGIHRWAQQRAGVDFPIGTDVGAALKITHGWGLVISAGARIGSNVTLFHGVTIGQKDKLLETGRASLFPVIGNSVWIGAHAVIVGGVTIGDGAIIGPGTIVTANVAPATVVVGNPMRVIKTECIPDVVNMYQSTECQVQDV